MDNSSTLPVAGRNFKACSHVQSSEHDTGLVLLDVLQGTLYAANCTGARIWQHVIEGSSLNGIVSDLSQHYGISQQSAAASAIAFLSELHRRGLVSETSQVKEHA